ncbi:MAG: cation-transporting P-type ATPase [Thermodesulfovibrionales bacterium]|nr:cation-transporting P-type ATPase [Thermodesulfovibrionales bacterium]
MKIHDLTKEEVFRTLVTSADGLSEEEAKRRLAEFGYNEIEEVKKKPLIFKFLSQLTHFLAILLWVAALFSFLSEYIHPGEGMLTLGLAIVGVIFINAIFAFIQEYRVEKALAAMKKLLPFYVRVLRNGKEAEISAREVVPGDVVTLMEGDKVPADIRIIETNEIKVNNAPLTGESEPVGRTKEPFSGELINSQNIAFAGTMVVSGSAKGIIFSTGMRTEFGRIAHLTSAVEPGLSPLQKEIVKATRVVATIAAAVGIFFFLLGFVIGRTFWENFIFAIGITVALIPEGMLPTVTLALAMGSQRLAKRNALIKNLASVETLGSVSVICTDKTGTLTQNKMEVKKVAGLCDNAPEKVQGISLFHISLLCNNTKEAEGNLKGEPTEVALYKAAVDSIGHIENKRLKEFPFDSDRKRMSIINSMRDATYVLAKGAPESILQISSYCFKGKDIVPFNKALEEKSVELYHSLMDQGLRVLAFAYREVKSGEVIANKEEAERDMIFIGFIGLEDPPRPEVAEAIQKCREAGIRIIMITGDGSRTAAAIAKEIGLIQGKATIVEGAEFLKMSDAELHNVLSNEEIIFSRMTPKHKLRVVNVLKEQGERVAVTGDGVNDAPALKRADIGVSMGITGTDVAKEASDMVLLDDNFATIVNAIEEGRTVYENIKKFITYIFASNIPEAVPYLAYILLRIPLPLTIMQILAIDLGTDMLPALALGSEKPTPGIMKQPPRKAKERLLNMPLISRAYLFLGPIEAIACMFGFFWILYGGGWTWGTMLPTNNILYMQATTACLTAIIITQIGNVFACRSSKEPVLSIGFFSNRLIFIGIIVELLLQLFIVYHPWGNKIFSTAPIPLSVWLLLIPFMFLVFFAEELRKFLNRRRLNLSGVLK